MPLRQTARRRWLTLSLRTLFVLVTVLCVALAQWTQRQNAIKKRDERIVAADQIQLVYRDSLFGYDLPDPIDLDPVLLGCGTSLFQYRKPHKTRDDQWYLRWAATPTLRGVVVHNGFFLFEQKPPQWLLEHLRQNQFHELTLLSDDQTKELFGSQREIRLVYALWLSTDTVEALCHCKNLRHLNAGLGDVDNEFLARICETFPNLETLEFSSNSKPSSFSATDLSPLCKLPNLKRLRLDMCDLTPSHVQQLARLTSLEELSVEFNGLTEQEVEPLTRLPHMQRLNYVDDGLSEHFEPREPSARRWRN